MILTFKQRTMTYIGRNGSGKQVGIEVLPIAHSDHVTLCPVNGKGIANCMLEIPTEDIPELISALQQAAASNQLANAGKPKN